MFQQTIAVGNVGKDAEMRYTPAGQPVTSFSVATNSQYTAKDGEVIKKTVWFRVTVWGKAAEACHIYVKKGMTVMVVGTLVADDATGSPKVFKKQDGSSGATFEINAQTVKFLSRVEGNHERGDMERREVETGEEDFPF